MNCILLGDTISIMQRKMIQDYLGLSGAEGILNQPYAGNHLSTKGCVTTNNINCMNEIFYDIAT